MPTPAEENLVDILGNYLIQQKNKNQVSKIINLGAGKSIRIEKFLIEKGCKFICDRVDTIDSQTDGEFVGKCYISSIECMTEIPLNRYTAGFSNYVLEHIQDLNSAAFEIYRILKPGGVFLSTIPNPGAPEFWLSKRTPVSFHRWIRFLLRGTKDGYEVYYSYKNLKHLIKIFESAGFICIDIKCFSFIEIYFRKSFILLYIARLYDRFIRLLKLKYFMGSAIVVFKKPW